MDLFQVVIIVECYCRELALEDSSAQDITNRSVWRFHIFFSLNSSTRFSSGVIVAHLTPTPYFLMALAQSIVIWSSVSSRFWIDKSKKCKLSPKSIRQSSDFNPIHAVKSKFYGINLHPVEINCQNATKGDFMSLTYIWSRIDVLVVSILVGVSLYPAKKSQKIAKNFISNSIPTYGKMSFSLIRSQMIRVISSPGSRQLDHTESWPSSSKSLLSEQSE